MCQELPRQMPQTQTGSTVMLGTRRLPQHPLKRGAAVITCTLPTFLQIRENSVCSCVGI